MASVPVPGSPTGRPASGDPRPGPSSARPAPGRPPQSSEEQAGRGPPARFSIRPASSRSAAAVSGIRRPRLLELCSIFEGDPEAGGPRSPPRESRRRENSESGGGETRGAARTGPSSGGALPPRVVPKPPVETSAAQMRNKSTGSLWPGSGSCTPGTANPGVDRPGWKQDFHDRSKSLDWRESSRAGPGFEKEANGPVRTAAPEERKPGATQWGSSPPRPPRNQDRGGGSDQAGADAYVSSAGRAEQKSGGAAPGPLWGSVGKGAQKILIVAERTRSGKSLPARIRPEPGFCTAWARRDDPGPRRPSPTFAEAVARGSMAEAPRRGSPVHARGPSPAQDRPARVPPNPGAATGTGAVQDKDASPGAGRTSGNYVSERLQPGSADQAAARDQEPSRGASLRDPGNIPAGAGRPGPPTARGFQPGGGSSSGSSCSSSSSSSSSRDSVFGSGVPSRLLERTHRGGPYPARVRPVTHGPSWERGPVSGAMTRTVTAVQRSPNSGVLSQQREQPRKPWDESRYRSHASASDLGRQISIQERPPTFQPSQSRSGGGGGEGGSRPDFRDTAVSTETVRNKIHRFETLAHRKDSPAPKPDQRPGPSSSFQRAARVFSETAPGADPQRRGRPAWRRGDEERAAAWVRSASLDSAPRLGNPPADPDGEEKAGGGDPWVGGPPAGSDPRGSRPRTGTEDECDSPAPKPTVPDSRTAAAPQEDTSEPGSPLVVEGPLPLGPIAGNFNNNSSNGLPPSPLARAGLAPPSRPAGHLPDLVPSGLLREPHPGKTPFPRTCSPGLPRPPDQTGESLRLPPPAAPESRDTWGRWSSEEEDSRSESSESSEGHDTDSDRSDSGSSSLTITSSFSQSDRRSFSVSLADLCGLGGADDWDDSDAEDSRSLRSASLSSSMSSALSMVSIIPHDELESLLDDVRAAGEETLANCEDIQVVVLHKEAGSGLGFTVAGGVDQNKPVTVHRVFPCGLAAQEGSIREGDRVLSINGTALQAAAHWEALRTLRRARSREQAIVVLRKGTCTPAATAEPQGTQPHGLPTGDAQPGKTVHLILTKSSSDLGFSLEGGRGSNQGDRPLTVKKVFPGGPVDQVLPGDEVLEVKGRSLRGLRRLEAWNWIKMLPPGPVEVLLQRPCRL
ncbi:pro-interleukin-16 [Lepisosteus oculatus]|uniref:pro-interleukin-16 n=1 Tax=Lepisosteus oculatus TaxID=7918 RepID=UPI003715CB43